MALPKQTSPTGLTQWGPLPGTDDMTLIWIGPGGGLFLGIRANQPGGSMSRIEHPSASDTYMTQKDAQKAVDRFMALRSKTDGQ